MKPTKAWAIVDEKGKIMSTPLPEKQHCLATFDNEEMAEEQLGWYHRHNPKIVRVEISIIQQ